MKTLSRRAIILSIGFLIYGCATLSIGNSTRENALIPALRASWPGVSDDVERGISASVQSEDLPALRGAELHGYIANITAALAGSNLGRIREATASWHLLHPWGARGISDRIIEGEITPGVAASLSERLKQFNAAIFSLQSGD